uniref:Uncharacterized protein n=1 Tax=viral metagenome TaxID=1070528 RepID=A0A6M3KFY9_9ZZZZ
MCWLSDLFKKKLAIIPGQVDTIPGCDPTQDWLDGKMPSYNIPALIEHLDYRKSIHETYYGLIVEGKFDPAAGYGDANFHLWAIEGYENAIYYLKKLQEAQP